MSIRNLVNSLAHTAARNSFVWKVVRPFAILGNNTFNARQKYETTKNDKFDYRSFFSALNVLNGPFSGMKYPRFDSVGSVICPKLIGSYEKELHPVLERLKERNYTDIIDVGCAEGYYAIGLGLMFPLARIYAYDLDPRARSLCSEMAAINGLTNRIEIREACTPEDLGLFPFKGRGLILSDCEGFEKKLFNYSNMNNMETCDIIVECHDFIDLEISVVLEKLLSLTHRVERIKSLDDIEKAHTYDFPQTNELSLQTKMNIFAEGRPTIMNWLVAYSQK